ncbi:MAG: M67 family peptidase [Bacteroidetes bacterium]|nr:MAG: M67 family peptidase [Bacteroidota bacterium]
MDFIPEETSQAVSIPHIQARKPEGAVASEVYREALQGQFRHQLALSPEVLHLMKIHAEATYPNECCGVFFGKEGQVREIHLMQALENSHQSQQQKRFEISATDYMKAERFALENGLDLLGVYHSHPDHLAIPSVHDQQQALPFFSYIILSVINGKTDHIRSWRLDDEGVFDEEQISIY